MVKKHGHHYIERFIATGQLANGIMVDYCMPLLLGLPGTSEVKNLLSL